MSSEDERRVCNGRALELIFRTCRCWQWAIEISWWTRDKKCWTIILNTRRNDVSPLHTKYDRLTHPRTIPHHRRHLLNDKMLRPVSSQARRLNYGRDGRILMLPRTNKTQTNGGAWARGASLYFRRKKREPWEFWVPAARKRQAK